MSDKTLYYIALQNLNFDIGGSDDLENIGRKLINFMYSDYNFEKPEGGAGRKDGGYDGYDTIKKAKLACSSEKNYKSKIKSELEKSKKNSDREIFYFSNREIPQVKKNEIKQEFKYYNIDLHISGIEDLSQKIDEFFQKNPDRELYDLLGLSSLITGEKYRRNEVIPQEIKYNKKKYSKKINIIESNLYNFSNNNAVEKISENPLHIVSAQLSEYGITYGQKTVGRNKFLGKSNEIPAVQDLINLLDIKGCLVAADALNCQKETAQTIIKNRGDYVLSVKENHKELQAEQSSAGASQNTSLMNHCVKVWTLPRQKR